MSELEQYIQTLNIMQSQYSHIRRRDPEWQAIEAAKDSLSASLTRSKGCAFCHAEHTEWGEGGAHDFRIDGNILYYFDAQYGWEGTKVCFCPKCGRQLTQE